MESQPTKFQTLLDRQQIADIKRRFQNLHRVRLQRIQDSLKIKQQSFLDLLPLLFHANHEMLPGFISEKTPYGISDFRPSTKSLALVKRRHKGFIYRVKALQAYPILSIFLMGSVGSIAYSRKSDFDIWICVRQGLSSEESQLLLQKTEKIHDWAENELSLEVHFFIMYPDHFREFGHDQDQSEESSGNRQHHLLLEEFYRTSLLIAGRFPVWWLVPVEQENRYEEYVQALCREELVQPFEFLDFGGLANVDISEFFGSALWQLYKAVHSPNKSFLKIILMEAYAADYPNFDFPCQRMKQAIHQGEQDSDNLDPYILMTNRVEQYLLQNNEVDRLEMARKCFYYKIKEPMSKTSIPSSLRREMLKKLVDHWGWDQSALKILDSRSHWKSRLVMEEREILIDQLTKIYKRLAEFSRKNARYTTRDAANLNILGRKLFSAFEKKAGKIEFINPRLAFDMTEEKLSFVQQSENASEGWLLYDSEQSYDVEFIREPIKASKSLLEVLAWCHFNAVLDRTTAILLQTKNPMMRYQELQSYIQHLAQLFPKRKIPEPSIRDLAKAETIKRAFFFINIGHDPLHDYSNQGLELISGRTDALSYSGLFKNLVYSLDALFITSWQEALTSRHQGEHALLESICDYFAWFPLKGEEKPAQFECLCLSGSKGPVIANRVQEIFSTIADLYYPSNTNNVRFILRMESAYYIVQADRGFLGYQHFNTYQKLIDALELPRPEYSRIQPDKVMFSNSPLCEIFSRDKPHQIQVYFYVKGQEVDVYVMDEKGSLTIQTCNFFSLNAIIKHYRNFLDAISIRRSQHMPLQSTGIVDNKVHFYEIKKSFQGHFTVSSLPDTKYSLVVESVNIRILGELRQSDRLLLSIYTNEKHYSTLEFGNHIYEQVARDILRARKGRKPHPVYVSDVDISRSFIGSNAVQHLQTAHYLQFKRWVEERLAQTIARIAAGSPHE